MTTVVDLTLQERQSALTAVLESKEFVRSPALAKLLRYLCEQTFQGKIHEIKELTIATDVYGKDLHFGEKRDSLVRVEVSRLRRRLQRYYDTDGAGSRIRILIKSGTYRPEFERIDTLPVESTGITECSAEPAARPVELRRWGLYAGSALVMAVAIWSARSAMTGSAHSGHPAGTSPELIAANGPKVPPTPAPVRILAGSTAPRTVDRFGVEWLGDRYFTGGQNTPHFGGQERNQLRPIIRRAPDQTPFRSFRYGNFTYRIPLAPAKYELRLYFAEVVLRQTDSGDGVENLRVFDVHLNGKPLLPYFDIAAGAGGVDNADIRIFENVSPAADGFVTLDFRSIREAASVHAIELIPNPTGQALPIRVVTRNGNYTDSEGNLWSIDKYFAGGRQTSDGVAVAGTKDPELFAWQRYGHFSYHFPVPAGKYRIRLLFAETFFGPGNRGKGGVGSRIFNVYCGGSALIRQLDIFKEAGEGRALEKVFHNISPSPQGRIDLTFEPVVQYPMVQAIEILPEGPVKSL